MKNFNFVTRINEICWNFFSSFDKVNMGILISQGKTREFHWMMSHLTPRIPASLICPPWHYPSISLPREPRSESGLREYPLWHKYAHSPMVNQVVSLMPAITYPLFKALPVFPVVVALRSSSAHLGLQLISGHIQDLESSCFPRWDLRRFLMAAQPQLNQCAPWCPRYHPFSRWIPFSCLSFHKDAVVCSRVISLCASPE